MNPAPRVFAATSAAMLLLLLPCACRPPAEPGRQFSVRKAEDGSFSVSFRTPFMFGDQVTYKSATNGEGSGAILDIVVQQDGGVYYAIGRADGSIQSGIYPDEMQLVSRKER